MFYFVGVALILVAGLAYGFVKGFWTTVMYQPRHRGRRMFRRHAVAGGKHR